MSRRPWAALALATLVLSGCATPAKPLWVAAHPLRPSLLVTLTVPAQGPVAVEVRVPQAVAPQTAREAPLRFLRLPADYGSTVLRPPQTALTLAPGAEVVLHYEVDLPVLDAPGAAPALERPFRTAHGAHLPLWALVPDLTEPPWAPFDTAELRVVTEEPVVSSLPQADDAFVANSAQALYDALVLVGPRTVQQGALTVASTDLAAERLGQVERLLGRAASVLERRLGGRSRLTFLALHAPPERNTEEPWVAGRNFGSTSAAFLDVAFDGSASSLGGQVLVHELVHAFLPADAALPHWITEGFTEYFALRLVLELDGLPQEALSDALAQRWAGFVAAAPHRRALENTLGDYYGGAVLAYCIDQRLRRDGHTLEQVLARAQRRAAGRVVNDLWEQEIALASSAAGALVLSAQREPLAPITDCFGEAGLSRAPPQPALRTGFIAQALGLESRELDPRRLDVRIAKVGERSKLKAGDVVRSTGGERTLSWDHWAEQLHRACAGGTATQVGVQRGAEAVSVDLELPPCGAPDTVPSPREVWVAPPKR